jgi:cytochrome c-type biogenesis protein CcmH/NrfF
LLALFFRMRILWFIPLTLMVLSAGVFVRARRRASLTRSLTSEPVSGQWLAEARSREEHPW